MVYLFLFLIVAVATAGIVYIYFTFKINKAYIQVRDASSALDTCLFEKYHMFKKLNEIMTANNLSTESITSANIQIRFDMTVAEERRIFQLFRNFVPTYEEAAAELNNEEFSSLLNKYKEYDSEIIKAAIKSDNSTEIYNQILSGFPAEQIAARKKKYSRSYFDVDSVNN